MTSSYFLLDFGSGKRLEQWGSFRLVRPDPTAVGAPLAPGLWEDVDAMYEGEKGKGEWKKNGDVPDEWKVTFGDLTLAVRLAPYKHTGVFPEQQVNWAWARARAKERGKNPALTILNLFAYTGGATVALAKDGHFVTHVDSSKPAVAWAKKNAELNAVPGDGIRWILDDAVTFVAREKKRGKTYDAIILDPPAYGHSDGGKTWRVERDLSPLLEDCVSILSKNASFLLLNGYAKNDTPENFHRLLTGICHTKRPGSAFIIEADELDLRTRDGRALSTGTVVRCMFGA